MFNEELDRIFSTENVCCVHYEHRIYKFAYLFIRIVLITVRNVI